MLRFVRLFQAAVVAGALAAPPLASRTLAAPSAAAAAAPAAVATPLALPGGAQASTLPPAPNIDYALSSAQIAANCATQIGSAKRAVALIAAVPARARSFTTVVLPLENATADLGDRLMPETLLSSVSTSRPVRDASLACQNDVNDFITAMTARPDLATALAAAKKTGTATTEADRKLVDLWLVAFTRAGALLPAAKRTEFVALGQRLSKLQNDFGANLGNDKTTLTLSQAQAVGLPSDFLAAQTKTPEGYIVRVDESTSIPFMTNASDSNARKRFYLAYSNRAYPRNQQLLTQAIGVRDRLAHLLGYPNWAAYVLADRMASSPARVTAFLASLDAKLLPRAKGELARLAALKAKDLHVDRATIDAWDVAYYDNLLRKTQYAVDTNEIRTYFPVDHVERAVFDIYAKILGVTFVQRTNPNVWSPDVTQWAVSDAATGRYIGDFYLDLFPRDGKYTHFASFPLLPNRGARDGDRPPLDAIIGNWPKAAPGKPALLSHADVETFFHEFGHDMATMLATTPYETLSSGFRQDFVEAPSQMLENWVWDPTILKTLSSNVTTGQPLPDATIAKMRAARYVDDAYFTTRQIMLATIDITYHTSGPNVDTTAIWATVARSQSPLPLTAGTHPEASFEHLMGGYDAGYYGYLWSKVYAQDMFTAFQAGGLESPVVGARYRQDILAPARQREPDDEVRAFLGRPMNPAAFYAEFDATGATPLTAR